MNQEPIILQEARAPVGVAQIVEWTWPSPLEVTVREDRHMFEMSLPPFATDGVGCFPDFEPGRYRAFGNMFLRPANLALRARGPGGRIRVVRCAVDPAQFAGMLDRDGRLTASELRACLDLRGPALETLFKRLRDELTAPGFASAALIDAYAIALVIEAARSLVASDGRAGTGRMAGWQLRRIEDRITHGGPSPSVTELAALCGVSARHLLRLYRNLTGETLSARIEREQFGRAQRLLRDTDLPMKSIAQQLGFAQAGSFSSAFRRAAGVTPRSFRQRNGGVSLGGRK